jgi:hypothetical protein
VAGIFNSAIFNNAVFNTGAVTPVPTGGHFGFDEKKRKKRFKEELAAEATRREALQAALFGVPESQQEAVAQEVFGVPVVEDWTPYVDTAVRFDAVLASLKQVAETMRQIEWAAAERKRILKEDDDDIEALIRFGAI